MSAGDVIAGINTFSFSYFVLIVRAQSTLGTIKIAFSSIITLLRDKKDLI